MLLIFASRGDGTAGRLLDNWKDTDVALLAPAALSGGGWCYQPCGRAGSITVDGRRLSLAEIDGVYVRLPCVVEEDLPHIVPEDRAYVAAEMTAFLLSWLNELPCPVVNRPTDACLCGPSWRSERWLQFASRRGIPVVPIHRHVANGNGGSPSNYRNSGDTTVTIVGDRWFGDCHGETGEVAVAMARAAGADVLAATFESAGPGARLTGAHVWPDVSSAPVATALRQLLLERR